MTILEAHSESRPAEHHEPEASQPIFMSKEFARLISHKLIQEMGFRIKQIEEDGVHVLDPNQEIGKRQPPVRVSVPRDPGFTEKYLSHE